MRFEKIINTNTIVKELIINSVKEGSIALDCTVGNGHDTSLLAELVGDNGKVYGFDIQNKAIEITSDLLIKANLEDRVILIEDSHENIDKYIEEKLDFIIYNLGYLPSGDKSIKTNKESTIRSIMKSLILLNNRGLMAITVYVGHNGGLDEKNAIEELLRSLNQKEYNVLKYDFINQINNPPILYVLERLIQF